MGFSEGLTAYRSGDLQKAADEFHAATEEDPDNHKAWNALGTVLSRAGDYETAADCFENALMLDPGNTTYEKNREKNDKKRKDDIPVLDTPKKETQQSKTKTKQISSTYTRNWLQIPLFFVPIIGFIINPVIGFLALLVCAWYIKSDADSLGAGANPNGSPWGRLKGWEWGLLLFFFWILLPFYAWKREQVYEENLGYSSSQPIQNHGFPDFKVVGGIIIVGLIFLLIVGGLASFFAGMSHGDSSTQSSQISTPVVADKTTISPTHTITRTPTPEPTNKVTMGERNAAQKALIYLKVSPFSRDGLIKQLEFEGYSQAESVYGADQSGANWNEQAALKAENYLDLMSFSRDGLINQLEFEGFTRQQAEYGVAAVGY